MADVCQLLDIVATETYNSYHLNQEREQAKDLFYKIRTEHFRVQLILNPDSFPNQT
jgi:hypothetical protein